MLVLWLGGVTANMPTKPEGCVYKPSEVAKMLRVDMRTVYGMIERGELPSIKVGRLIRIPVEPVDTLLGKKPGSATDAASVK